jgi:hypothetical protein
MVLQFNGKSQPINDLKTGEKMDTVTWFDCKPTHRKMPDNLIRAEEEAAWALKAYDEAVDQGEAHEHIDALWLAYQQAYELVLSLRITQLENWPEAISLELEVNA